MNDGKTIISKQNMGRNINLLAAQRQVYRSQKRMLFILFILNIVVVVGLAVIASILQSATINEWVAVYGVFLTFLDVVLLTPLMRNRGKKAASIQEMFDCDVLGLPHHIVKKPDSVDDYDISQAAKCYEVNSGSSLDNWYSGVKPDMGAKEAVHNAQHTNIWWDKKQKIIFQKWAMIALVLLICIVVLTAFKQDLGFRRLLIYVMPLILPAVMFWYQFHSGLASDISRLEKLETLMNSLAHKDYDHVKARQVQDAIYEHRRVCTPIFDWVYERYQKLFEKKVSGG